MKTFISADEIERLDREAFEQGELLANVMMPLARVSAPAAPVLDELGRAWELPRDDAGLGALYAQYCAMHGRLSSAVDGTFTRHGRLNDLRMLVLRCVQGEPVNLAARALALGPVEPYPRPASWPADKPWVRDVLDARMRAEVEREARRMRAAGYMD